MSNNECGLANGNGPCTATNGPTLCQSGACSQNGNCEPSGGCNVDGDCAGGRSVRHRHEHVRPIGRRGRGRSAVAVGVDARAECADAGGGGSMDASDGRRLGCRGASEDGSVGADGDGGDGRERSHRRKRGHGSTAATRRPRQRDGGRRRGGRRGSLGAGLRQSGAGRADERAEGARGRRVSCSASGRTPRVERRSSAGSLASWSPPRSGADGVIAGREIVANEDGALAFGGDRVCRRGRPCPGRARASARVRGGSVRAFGARERTGSRSSRWICGVHVRPAIGIVMDGAYRPLVIDSGGKLEESVIREPGLRERRREPRSVGSPPARIQLAGGCLPGRERGCNRWRDVRAAEVTVRRRSPTRHRPSPRGYVRRSVHARRSERVCTCRPASATTTPEMARRGSMGASRRPATSASSRMRRGWAPNTAASTIRSPAIRSARRPSSARRWVFASFTARSSSAPRSMGRQSSATAARCSRRGRRPSTAFSAHTTRFSATSVWAPEAARV